MAFSQTGILDVRVAADGPDLFVAWTSILPSGDDLSGLRRPAAGLVWRVEPVPRSDSRRRHAWVRNIWVEVGTVDAVRADGRLLLPAWSRLAAGASGPGSPGPGGTYLDPTGRDDIQGFRISRDPTPGGSAVDLATIRRRHPCRPILAGWINDGFGKGGFGGAGFGRAATLVQLAKRPACLGRLAVRRPPLRCKAGNALGAWQPR